MYTLHSIFKFIIIFFIISTANSSKKIQSEKCAPYFVSLKVIKANSHIGPGLNYKNVYKYQIRYTPLLVIAKYDHWRQVTDMNKSNGWLHKSQLSTTRYLMVKENTCTLFENPNLNSKKVAILKKEVIMKLNNIIKAWCYVTVIINGKQKYKGYVKNTDVFGLLNSEMN